MRVVAAKGYAATTVADLTREAGVSRTTFYELFEDKEACFLAAYDGAVEALVRRVSPPTSRRRAGRTGPAAGLAALLEALAESRRWRGLRWSTSATPDRRRSAATGPRCSG